MPTWPSLVVQGWLSWLLCIVTLPFRGSVESDWTSHSAFVELASISWFIATVWFEYVWISIWGLMYLGNVVVAISPSID